MAKAIDIKKLTDEQRRSILVEINRQNGQKGGLKTRARGSEYYREIGKKGAAKRWSKKD